MSSHKLSCCPSSAAATPGSPAAAATPGHATAAATLGRAASDFVLQTSIITWVCKVPERQDVDTVR